MSTRSIRASDQRGVALIEVLVAFLILSVGLLGFSALQVRALKATQSSLQRTDAVMLANSILESMRANRAAALLQSYNRSKTCGAYTATGSLANADLAGWFAALQSGLGSGQGTCGDITCNGEGMCTVNVYWDDSRAQGGSATQSLQMVSRL